MRTPPAPKVRLLPPGSGEGNRFWWVVVSWPDGRRIKASSKAARKSEAERFARELVAGHSPAEARRRLAAADDQRRAETLAAVREAQQRLKPLRSAPERWQGQVVALDRAGARKKI